ncbi:F-box protein [Trifolium medium]|uniref:F-box protein n=1 Tax=Trifolium medium TaxID=97028 RepID=A0A392MFA4_9FABA|nr:F-box protein [Trifolium medium]
METKKNNTVYIPAELIAQILLNLPVKSLIRFKAIHWICFRRDLLVKVIVVFDLMERKLFEVNLPNDLEHYPACCGLWVFEGFLSIWALSYAKHTIEIWVMKDYKLRSSWTKTLVLLIDDVPNFSPIFSTKSSDMIGTTYGGYGLVKYNDKRQTSEYRSFYNNRHRCEVAVYTESLLSLPGDREQV